MGSMQTNFIRQDADAIDRRYDAENDLIPGAPEVTYTDMQLLELIRRLVIVVEDLQDQI
jgi:hypothetical protein